MRIKTDASKCRHSGCPKYVINSSGFCTEHKPVKDKSRRCSVCNNKFVPKQDHTKRCDTCVENKMLGKR